MKLIDRVCLSTNGNASRISRNIQESSTSFGGCEHIRQRDIEPAFTTLVQRGVGALLVRSDTLFNGRTEMLVVLASRHALPAIYPQREFVVAGGLMSYGASLRDALRQVGLYTGKILMGAKSSDLPVIQAVKVELNASKFS